MRPPSRKRAKCSYHFTCRSAAKLIRIFIGSSQEGRPEPKGTHHPNRQERHRRRRCLEVPHPNEIETPECVQKEGRGSRNHRSSLHRGIEFPMGSDGEAE